jgi:hypothetical protein
LSLHQRQLVGQYWFEFAKPAWLRRREGEKAQSATLALVEEPVQLPEKKETAWTRI